VHRCRTSSNQLVCLLCADLWCCTFCYEEVVMKGSGSAGYASAINLLEWAANQLGGRIKCVIHGFFCTFRYGFRRSIAYKSIVPNTGSSTAHVGNR